MCKIFSEAAFRIQTNEKKICLTFDDGPDIESTLKILEILRKKKVTAVFFLTGQNAENHPRLRDLILTEGHITGNHGYRHVSGWSLSCQDYLENISRAAESTSDKFFRPPYGRITLEQYRKVKDTFKIVFWDLMPYDFQKNQSAANCLRVLKTKIRPGTIIALHDKPESKVLIILDEFIDFAINEGYRFISLE